jgi:beta-lactamase class A
MTADTSTANQTTNSTPSVRAEASSRSSTQRLSESKLNTNVKTVLLRAYLSRVVTDNERTNIRTGVSVINMQSGQSLYGHNLDDEHFAASVNKIPIALLVLRDVRAGTLQFDQTLTWPATDVRAGAGTYDQPGAPTSATVQELLFDMLNKSGNTAVRVFVNQALGGAAAVNGRFSQELQLQHTYLQPLEGTAFYVGNTSTREAMKNMSALLNVDDSYTDFVKEALATNIYTDYGVRSQLAGNDYIVLSNKVGILDDPEGNNRHDVGVIYNTKSGASYGYAFLNTAPGAAYNLATAQAGVSLADMGRAVLRYSGDKATQERALRDNVPHIDRRVRF